jgi:hypothetical protein
VTIEHRGGGEQEEEKVGTGALGPSLIFVQLNQLVVTLPKIFSMADTDMLLNKKLLLQMRDAWWWNPDTASH